jgi:FixJ family two-component response regulator
MPGLGGLELQRRLVESGSAMPIILISAHEDRESIQESLSAGAVAFLKKPFEDDILIKTVSAALNRLNR